jgi:hypothetical protein
MDGWMFYWIGRKNGMEPTPPLECPHVVWVVVDQSLPTVPLSSLLFPFPSEQGHAYAYGMPMEWPTRHAMPFHSHVNTTRSIHKDPAEARDPDGSRDEVKSICYGKKKKRTVVWEKKKKGPCDSLWNAGGGKKKKGEATISRTPSSTLRLTPGENQGTGGRGGLARSLSI